MKLGHFLTGVMLLTGATVVSAQQLPDSVFVRTNYTKVETMIPMRDGVRLFTSIYVPKDSSTRHPIMMTRSPYSCAPYGIDRYPTYLGRQRGMYFRAGYILVIQDVRGCWMSEGTFEDVRPFLPVKTGPNDIDEASDTYDTVEWLIHNLQTSNGNVGVEGISYPGFYSWMSAIAAHPAVKAVSPQAPVSQWMSGDDFFHNGAFLLPHAFDFFSGFGRPRPAPTSTSRYRFDHGTPDGYKFFLDLGPLANANKRYLHDSVAFWNTIMENGTWNSFWAARSVLPHLKDIRPATLVVGGWFDSENLYGALHSYAELERNQQTGRHSIVMGPWSHGQWARDSGDSLGYTKWNSATAAFYLDSIEFPFFEHYLRGKGSPRQFEAAVFMTGANEWRFLDQWPARGTVPMSWFMGEGGSLSMKQPSDAKNAFDEYVSDPKKPVPYTSEVTHWYNAAFPVEDQRFAAKRPDVLVYESPILNEDMTVAGPIDVNLFVSTSGTDCDWVVKVIDVLPESSPTPAGYPNWVKKGGNQMMVRGDVLRGKFRNSLAAPEPFVPGKVTPVRFRLNDVFHRFQKGHRLMVQIQSTWFPMIDLNPGKFIDIYHAGEKDFQATTQRVYRSGKQASSISLPLLHE